jgi:butyryl-CoA dehydrogenase
MEEVKAAVQEALELEPLRGYASRLVEESKKLQKTSMHLMGLAMQEKPEVFLADATLFLEYFGTIVIAWQWLRQATVAQKALLAGQEGEELRFYQSKMHTFRYFFEYELPKVAGLHERLNSPARVTLEAAPEEIV